ncbi:MAG: hypothetical protein DRJ08_02950 [Acidobacteria bacterium]|nr:MAG: hypothetical protein DRJ14_02165 [Acidobacteriota bacterium]RLE23185.1 MAG: hypothetical protein DRJ08_02950 [Acidobacteriota bacterium]
MIAAGNTPVLFSIVVAVSAFAFIVEQRTQMGKKLSGVVIAMFSMMLLANLKLVPGSAPSYDFVFHWVVPVAIPMFLFKANLVAIFRETGKTLIAFLIGGIGTIIGALTMFFLINRGEESLKALGLFTATYVGGTINFVAISEIMKIKGDMLASAVAADNVVMAVALIFLFLVPTLKMAQKFFKFNEEAYLSENSEEKQDETLFGGRDVVYALSISFVIAGLSMFAAKFIGNIPSILISTVVTVTLATIFPRFFTNIRGSEEIGIFFMYLFFAVVGASANFGVIIQNGIYLFLFAAGTISIHLTVILIGGKLLGIPLPEILIASNANLGGPTTACGMAMAKRWDKLIAPAVLVGIFGYAIATFVAWNLVAIVRMLTTT